MQIAEAGLERQGYKVMQGCQIPSLGQFRLGPISFSLLIGCNVIF